ncbi:diphosphomevalonate decarboxylase [Zopfochytrium polystomum]|nr:diphosphomevalonate decarboxylase [Zopfochytrium polystomum]
MAPAAKKGPHVTCSAPVNIAVIKYWGKRDEALLLPTNSSLSVTLSQDHLKSTTTVRLVSPSAAATGATVRDRIWLNGKEEQVSAKRLSNVLQEVRRLRRSMEAGDATLPRLADLPLHIASVNNFPTAAGLASSASGFACLTFALSQLFHLPLTPEQVSRMARVGSGSACRSLMGGFVAWDMGTLADGSDSMARQVAPESHWPDMCALVLVASDAKKETGSTEGMQQTVQTSALLASRVDRVVPARMAEMERAVRARDFDAFAETTMRDSNQFHAVCLDTFPPIFYMTDVSRAVVALASAYNAAAHAIDVEEGGERSPRRFRVAYTFDAGPNAVLYALASDVPEILRLVDAHFPPPADAAGAAAAARAEYYGRALHLVDEAPSAAAAARLEKIEAALAQRGGIAARTQPPGSLTRLIYTQVGDGPRLLARGWSADVSLLGQDGLPRVVAGSKRQAAAE